VRVNVGSSNVFRRQGTHLYHDATIPMHTAVLGGRVRVPTLDGEVEVRVSPGTQPGEDCVIRGSGVDSISRKGTKGDLFISFSVEIPRSADLLFHSKTPQIACPLILVSLHPTWRRDETAKKMWSADDQLYEFHRSLTSNQRDLMKQFADDIEGRSTERTTSNGGSGTRPSSPRDGEKRNTGATGKKTQAREQQQQHGAS